MLEYRVTGGKYSANGFDVKYCNVFETLDEAISDIDKLEYPFNFIEYKGRVIEVWDKESSPFGG